MSLYHTWKRDENRFPQHEPNKLLTNWCTNPGSSWVDAGSVDDREPRQLPVDNSLFRPQLLRSKRRKNISSMLSFHNTAKPLCVPADRLRPTPGFCCLPPPPLFVLMGSREKVVAPSCYQPPVCSTGPIERRQRHSPTKSTQKTLSFKFQKTCWRSSLIWSTDRSEQDGIHTYRFTYAVHLFGSWLLLLFFVCFLFCFFSAGAWTLCVCQFSAKWQSVNPGSFNSAALPVAGSRTVPQPGQLQEWTEPRAAFTTVGNVTIQHKAHEKEMVEFRFWGGGYMCVYLRDFFFAVAITKTAQFQNISHLLF